MSFGYSIGDFIAVGKLAWSTYQNSVQACGEYHELTREVKALYVVLDRLAQEVDKPDSPIGKSGDNDLGQLQTVAADCGKILQELDKKLSSHNALAEKEKSGRKLWQSIKFGNGEVPHLAALRGKINFYTSAMSLHLNMTSISSIGRIEKQMTDAGGVLKDMQLAVKDITMQLVCKNQTEGSVFTTYADDDKGFWKDLRRKLCRDGFPSSVIHKHKRLIMDYIKELGSQGVLDKTIPSEMDGSSPEPEDNFHHPTCLGEARLAGSVEPKDDVFITLPEANIVQSSASATGESNASGGTASHIKFESNELSTASPGSTRATKLNKARWYSRKASQSNDDSCSEQTTGVIPRAYAESLISGTSDVVESPKTKGYWPPVETFSDSDDTNAQKEDTESFFPSRGGSNNPQSQRSTRFPSNISPRQRSDNVDSKSHVNAKDTTTDCYSRTNNLRNSVHEVNGETRWSNGGKSSRRQKTARKSDIDFKNTEIAPCGGDGNTNSSFDKIDSIKRCRDKYKDTDSLGDEIADDGRRPDEIDDINHDRLNRLFKIYLVSYVSLCEELISNINSQGPSPLIDVRRALRKDILNELEAIDPKADEENFNI